MHADKQQEVNAIVMEYVKPVFGYALNRTGNRQDAEDLSQDILLQLMKFVSSAVEIQSLDAYVWTIARYTWIRWLQRKVKTPVEINGLPDDMADFSQDPLHLLLNNDALSLLRRELSYLSNLQRRIVVMYYYDGQSEASRHCRIPRPSCRYGQMASL